MRSFKGFELIVKMDVSEEVSQALAILRNQSRFVEMEVDEGQIILSGTMIDDGDWDDYALLSS